MNLARARGSRSHDPARAGSPRTRPANPSPQARLAAQRRARDRSLIRDGIVLVVVCAGLVALWPHRLVPNEEYPAALALTQRFDDLFAQIRSGREVAPDPTLLEPGIEGAVLEVGGDPRWVLTGEAARACYSLWWDEDGVRRGRTVPTALPCEPSGSLTSAGPQYHDRIWRAVRDPAGPYEWEHLLPDPLRYRYWFFLAIIVGAGIGVAAAVRMTIAMLTGNAPSAVRR